MRRSGIVAVKCRRSAKGKVDRDRLTRCTRKCRNNGRAAGVFQQGRT